MDNHRIFVKDTGTQALFRRAIFQTVKPGDAILDLGTGTGIHALFACAAGARVVYAVEVGEVIHLAKEVVRLNGFQESVRFVEGLSTRVELPERVDAIVTNQGLPEILEYLPDARRRFLKPHGRLIPCKARLSFVPLEFAKAYRDRIRFWTKPHYGLDFSPVAHHVRCQVQYLNFSTEQWLAEPLAFSPIDFEKELPHCYSWSGEFRILGPGTVHGLGNWFEFELSPDVKLQTKPPLSVGFPPWINSFFPLERPLTVKRGDRLLVEIDFSPQPIRSFWRWKVALLTKQQGCWSAVARLSQSTFNGISVSRGILEKLFPQASPTLSHWGKCAYYVLESLDKGERVGQIEKELYRSFRKVFTQPEEACVFVAEIIRKYT